MEPPPIYLSIRGLVTKTFIFVTTHLYKNMVTKTIGGVFCGYKKP